MQIVKFCFLVAGANIAVDINEMSRMIFAQSVLLYKTPVIKKGSDIRPLFQLHSDSDVITHAQSLCRST